MFDSMNGNQKRIGWIAGQIGRSNSVNNVTIDCESLYKFVLL